MPDYGQVWTPNEDADWSPYSDGNWVWEPYYGWTWVGNETWGWAPYHYGRWFRYGGAWRWWPGERGIRPVWAPAYVSFLGFGGHFGVGVGFGFGSIGWLPIGPCDPFFPWYGRFGFGFGFFGFNDFLAFRFGGGFHGRFPGAFEPLHGRFDERFSNFRQAEHDPAILRGVNSVHAGEFGHGVVAHDRGISSDEFHNSHFTSGGVPAVPTRESLSASNRSANPGTIRNNQSTRFFGKASRQSVQRSSFSAQAGRVQSAMRTAGGLPAFGNGARVSGNESSPASRARQPGNGNTTATPNRAGTGATQNARPAPAARSFEQQGTERPNTPTAPASGGWQRFNGPANTSSQGQAGRSGSSNTVNAGTRPPLDLRRPVVGGTQYNRPAPVRPTYSGNTAPAPRPSYGPPASSGRSSGGSSGGSSHGGSSGGSSHGSSHGSSGGSHGSSGHH